MQSNRLTVLKAEIETAHRAYGVASERRIEAALALGRDLIEAKSLMPHGEWLPFLKAANVPIRTAQRAMKLHRLGLPKTTIVAFGINDALALPPAQVERLRREAAGETSEIDGIMAGIVKGARDLADHLRDDLARLEAIGEELDGMAQHADADALAYINATRAKVRAAEADTRAELERLTP